MAKIYEVSFEFKETEGEIRQEPMNVPIGPQATTRQGAITRAGSAADSEVVAVEVIYEGPWIRDGESYVGPLTDVELRWVKMLNGKDSNPHWLFTLKEVS